jgi:glycosyltransferase involved in cell wall biosynthesis
MKKMLVIFANYVESYSLKFLDFEDIDIDLISTGKLLQGKVVENLDNKKLPKNVHDFIHLPIIFNNPIDYIVRFFFLLFLIPFILIKRHKIALFITPPHFLTPLSVIFKLCGKRTATFVNDDWVESAIYQRNIRKAFVIKPILRSIEFFGIRNTDYVFVVCDYLKNLYKPFNKKISVVPTSIDVKSVEKIKPKRIAKDLTIIYSGALFEYKGVMLLVKAFEKIKKDVPNCKLLIIGDGPLMPELKKIAKNEKDIILTGALKYDDAISFIKGSDISVIPFKKIPMNWTGSPGKCFDYIACHIPIVYTGGGQHSRFIQKFNVGIEADDNEEDLAKKITFLMKNDKLRKKFKENCKKFSKQIDYRELAKSYNEIVKKLIK